MREKVKYYNKLAELIDAHTIKVNFVLNFFLVNWIK